MQLDWPGTRNARDLGGLPASGGVTRVGALVRSASLDELTADGWQALLDHGVRTVIDLRNDDERGDDVCARPAEVATVHVPLDGSGDGEFWEEWGTGPQFGTPLYYRPHLERMPDRSAAAVAAIAHAQPGGVVFHCQGGCDRTGQVAMLVLALLGVPAREIAADYALSTSPDSADRAAFLEARGLTAGWVIEELLASFDVEASLRAGGLDDASLSALPGRLVST